MADQESPRRAWTRAPHPGITVLPSAEGPSLRSHPRWRPAAARRTLRLLDRLIAARRHPAAQAWTLEPHGSPGSRSP